MTKKLLYNTAYGGFGFSDELLERFGITGGEYSNEGMDFSDDLSNRTNPDVIKVVEEIGLDNASGSGCKLDILEIGEDDIYLIDEVDGKESLKFICRARNNLVY